MWRVPLAASNTMTLKGLCCKKVFILSPNPVTSRVESMCLALRCPLIFCMLEVLVRGVWKDETCVTKFWTTHVAQNLLSELHVSCEEGLVLRSQTAGQEAY